MRGRRALAPRSEAWRLPDAHAGPDHGRANLRADAYQDLGIARRVGRDSHGCGAANFGAFTGYAELLAGDHRAAAVTLEAALAALPSPPVRPAMASILLLDLATAHAHNDPQHALGLTGQAVESLRNDWYATARDRLPALRAALGGTPYRPELEERLRSLSGLAS